jgi:hypothetical protein
MTTRNLLFSMLLLLSIDAFSADFRQFRLTWREDPTTSMVVGWSGDGGTLHYGTEDFGTNWSQYPSNRAVDRDVLIPVRGGGIASKYVRLTGLQPKTVYYFVVRGADGDVSARYSFMTMSDNSDDPISFITGGDSRTGVPLFENCDAKGCREKRQEGNRLVAKIRPDFIVFNGDYVFDGRDQQQVNDWLNDWQLTISPDGRLFPIIASLGNHEDNTVVNTMFDTPTQDAYFAFSFGAASNPLLRFYTLNNQSLEACGVNAGSTAQLNWLKNDLANYSQPGNQAWWKFAQYHIPMAPQGYYDPRLDVRDCWLPEFTKFGVRLAMESHTHIFKISWPSVRDLTSPTLDRGIRRNDAEGTVFIGEGMWGAPYRPVDKPTTGNPRYGWTREAGTNFSSFFFVRLNKELTTIRTVVFDNLDAVEQLADNDQGSDLPTGIKLYDASMGAVNGTVVEIPNNVVSSTYANIVKDFASVFPNPAGAEFNLQLKQSLENAVVEIYDARGHLCETINVAPGEATLRLSTEKMCTGINFVMLKSDEGIQVLKLIKQ